MVQAVAGRPNRLLKRSFPFLRYAKYSQLPDGDDELFHRVLVEYQPLGDSHPNLDDWIRRVDARPRA
jgi:hypothetical protein